ncbi:MAG: alkaline phosphatase family protein [Pirellulales bacterium]
MRSTKIRIGCGLLATLLACHLLSHAAAAERPRLAVIVSVDQLCYEYLERFQAGFSDGGFFRLAARDGATFTEAHHRHAYTVTAPGHAVLMSGAYPDVNGIVGNDWYDRSQKKVVYCVEDAAYGIVGAPAGMTELKGVSPRNFKAETVGDVLKRETQGRAKVFGATLKDRAAVLMTGARADGAYWFDPNSGNWVTSRYYRESLPAYIAQINAQRPADSLAGKTWELLYSPDHYRLHYPDANPYEGDYEKIGVAFPHVLESTDMVRVRKQVACSRFGNEVTLELVEQILIHEQLGQDDDPDVFAVGFSSNDFVGHNFGPHSLEVQDVTYRTDLLLKKLVDLLNKHVGEGRWVLALSADHAVSPIPEYAATIGLPAKRNPLGDVAKLREALEARLVAKFGPKSKDDPYIERVDVHQMFLRAGDDGQLLAAVQQEAKAFMLEQPGIAMAVTRAELDAASPPVIDVPADCQPLIPKGSDPLAQFRLAYHPRLAGDVFYAIRPYSIQGSTKATHGTPWSYDSHVPVLFLGAGIAPGKYAVPTSPAAIAPTLAKILGIPAPGQCVERPLSEALR